MLCLDFKTHSFPHLYTGILMVCYLLLLHPYLAAAKAKNGWLGFESVGRHPWGMEGSLLWGDEGGGAGGGPPPAWPRGFVLPPFSQVGSA